MSENSSNKSNSDSESNSEEKPVVPKKKSSKSSSDSSYSEEDIKKEIKKSHSRSYSSDSSYSEEKSKKKSKKKKKSKTPEKLLNKKTKKDLNSKKKNSKKKSKKKKINPINEYLEREAEENENEEISDEEGEITDKEQERIMQENITRMEKRVKMQKIDELNQEELNKVIEKFENESMRDEENSNINMDKDFDRAIVRKDDPHLFLVRCKIGKEREVCESLFNKYFKYNKKELNLKYEEKIKIFSAFSFDALKGKIYIEAYNAAHVRHACQGIGAVFDNDKAIKIIPEDEMARVFEFDKFKDVNIKPLDFVRIKSGPYEKDLAQIVAIEDKLTKIYVKLRPRIEEESELLVKKEEKKEDEKRKESVASNFSNDNNLMGSNNNNNSENNINTSLNNNNNNNENKENANNKENKEAKDKDKQDYNIYRSNKYYVKKIKTRPVQKLININSYQISMTDKKIPGETLYSIGKLLFTKEGFLIKKVRFTSLITTDINPTMDELKFFQNISYGEGLTTDFQRNLLKKTSLKFRIKFNKGDRVVLTMEGLKGVMGKVVSHENNEVHLIVEEYSNDLLKVPEMYVIKQFLPGEIVTVIDGQHQGKSGMIIDIEENNTIAKIYNDITKNYFSVPCDYLILSSQFSYKNEENSLFRIGDLVKILNSNIFCYVLNVSAHTLNVVTIKNEVKNLSIRDVEKVKINKKLSELDQKRNPLNKENRVRVLDGPHKGKNGTVKYMFRNYIFLHNVEFVRSNGIFCETIDNVEILGAELLNDYGNNGRVNQRKIPDDIKNYYGKTVTIRGGNYKGYQGIVIGLGDKFLTIELSAKQKNVQVEPENVTLENGEKGNESPNMAGKTPAYYRENQQSDYDASNNKY